MGEVMAGRRETELLGGERGAWDGGRPVGRTVGARERAGVGLHDPHEPGAAAAGEAPAGQPHRGLPGGGGSDLPMFAVGQRGLGEEGEAPARP